MGVNSLNFDVRFQKKFVSILMLFVFGVLSLKILLAGTIVHGSCYEFGHIHLQKFHKLADNMNSLSDPAGHQGDHDDDDDDCHEGKSFISYSLFLAITYDFILPKFELDFKLIRSLKSQFNSPVLEPHRKPPKSA